MQTGKLKKYFEDKGFGFIVPDDGRGDVFFHHTGVLGSILDLRPGDSVEFLVEQARDGRFRAVDVQRVR